MDLEQSAHRPVTIGTPPRSDDDARIPVCERISSGMEAVEYYRGVGIVISV